ncbi:MAG: orotate phosphoribosyltransferase [Balneola sp.]|jgi:orotate phosphoribosyltransferase|nr:orotate phosphoribosyltransferase [Balneola sp.]MBE79230.1 orotate phosphoribosyltransferase [Balneola sp.]HBX65379.1 orotate phosphoribosyltransferase [Balneolaceae bacterium]|tara:strand:- start:21684 stop:22340 length:657 start_codon:yes stop_codon:yes gene_type:complete
MILNTSFARELAAHLLEINAVVLRPNDPFTWTSGWNSPIYCDNRLTLRFPEIRNKIENEFTAIVEEKFSKVDVITGTATAGIPHAAWVAANLNKPMAYVRAKAKAHGMGNQIEGGVKKDESTVIIEDLISTGGSAISVVEALKFVGANVEAVLSIFTYDFDKASQRFENANVPVYSLTDYKTLVNVAVEKGIIDGDDLDLLSSWRDHPDVWPDSPSDQ